MNTPIVDFVKKYAESNSLRLHMPGHKGNELLGCEKYDITEIDGADVLYSADGIIAESQENATKLFDTKATFYSTEGSSLCIRAMLYLVKCYALQNGKKPLVFAGRNAHKTFVTAAALLDIDVNWMLPQSTKTIISCVITADFLDEALKGAKEKPVAVYITSPDYLGCMSDIAALSKVCRKHGVLLIVDNAHGAYLKFLPEDIHPITLGADMCCDSAHKTLPVLTGGAYLHIGRLAAEFFINNAKSALSLFASTSPSYLILQSLDTANQYIYDGYCQNLKDFTDCVAQLKEALKKQGHTLYGEEPLKVTIATKAYGYTGTEFAELLASKNIICEFSDPDFIVFMFTPQVGEEGVECLRAELTKIKPKEAIKRQLPTLATKEQRLTLNKALFSTSETLPIDYCLGKISASTHVSCPPAIPIVLPGEIIDQNAIECFKYYKITEWEVTK
ncbi:MAG: PLP-dependent transferase [Clostridia bacterium]|nr:PLP-dependent transferase [Clostridia bacterium]